MTKCFWDNIECERARKSFYMTVPARLLVT